MSNKPANQVLLRKAYEDGSEERIRRGSDGSGYFWEFIDKKACVSGMFPVDQVFVETCFAEQGKVWRTE